MALPVKSSAQPQAVTATGANGERDTPGNKSEGTGTILDKQPKVLQTPTEIHSPALKTEMMHHSTTKQTVDSCYLSLSNRSLEHL